MLDRLLDDPLALAGTLIAVAAMNHVSWRMSRRDSSEQAHIDTTASTLERSSGRAELIQHFGLPVAIALLTLSTHRVLRPMSEGYLILQLATLFLNIDAWLRWRILRIAGIVEGRLVPTAEYQYRTSAARLVPLTCCTGLVAAWFASAPFAVGSVLLAATAIGWYRRAPRGSA